MQQWDPETESRNKNRCQGCGAHVSAAFRRTRGNPDGLVFACTECATYREIADDGAAIATDGGRSE